MKQKLTHQIKIYRLDLSQTDRNGTFSCPNCGSKISPNDHSEDTYVIYDTKLRGSDVDEIIITCKNCSCFIHLGGFLEIFKKGNSTNAEKMTMEESRLYVDHL